MLGKALSVSHPSEYRYNDTFHTQNPREPEIFAQNIIRHLQSL